MLAMFFVDIAHIIMTAAVVIRSALMVVTSLTGYQSKDLKQMQSIESFELSWPVNKYQSYEEIYSNLRILV